METQQSSTDLASPKSATLAQKPCRLVSEEVNITLPPLRSCSRGQQGIRWSTQREVEDHEERCA